MTPYQISSEIYGGFYYSGITLRAHKVSFDAVAREKSIGYNSAHVSFN